MEIFGTRLKDLRNAARLTQDELGLKVGKSKNSISQYENNKREPDHETLVALSNIFNVSIDYLLGNEKYFAIQDTKSFTNADLMREVSPKYQTTLSSINLDFIQLYKNKIENKITIEELEKIIDLFVSFNKKKKD